MASGHMIIWILFAVITTASTAALLHPLTTTRTRPACNSLEASVYRDQLLELEREVKAGDIGSSEYEHARAETARRLIRASGPIAAVPAHRSHRWLRLGVVAFLPIVSIGLYVGVGSPEMPSRPLQARLADPGQDLPILLMKTEGHLANDPDDGRGWDVIAPVYLKMGRVDDAEKAYRNAVRILGRSVQRLDGLLQGAMARSNGQVTEEARTILREMLQLEPRYPRARFYVALGMEQSGKRAEARNAFEALAEDSPADAPWLALVNEHIVANGGVLSHSTTGPSTPADIAASPAAVAGERKMIHAMVEGLDAKLAMRPDDIDGWLRLIKSYAVLDEKRQAAAALQRALSSFPAATEKGSRLVSLAQELQLDLEGTIK